MNPETIEGYWQDAKNWKRGVLYSCADDPRVIVPKKQKWRGWTLNFARPSAIPTLVLMMTLLGGPLATMIYFGYDPRDIYWWGTFVACVAVIIAICAYMASPRRYEGRERRPHS